ncbi:MAG: nucleotidyltransferase substrate binding protein [Arhodomonas sp.]|nr:nucleotidyltransferase substrate binding protein [Arhodomonas sp.]
MSTVLDSLQKALQRLRVGTTGAGIRPRPRCPVFNASNSPSSLRGRRSRIRARILGSECRSPKGCFKLAFQQGWIDDEAVWVAMLQDRNLTSHTYDEDACDPTVPTVYPASLPAFESLCRACRKGVT